MNLEYRRLQRDIPDFLRTTTTLIEFSRGSEHGGYASAFAHLSAELLSRAAVLYIDVPWEESLRKNRRRANPESQIASWNIHCRMKSWNVCIERQTGRRSAAPTRASCTSRGSGFLTGCLTTGMM